MCGIKLQLTTYCKHTVTPLEFMSLSTTNYCFNNTKTINSSYLAVPDPSCQSLIDPQICYHTISLIKSGNGNNYYYVYGFSNLTDGLIIDNLHLIARMRDCDTVAIGCECNIKYEDHYTYSTIITVNSSGQAVGRCNVMNLPNIICQNDNILPNSIKMFNYVVAAVVVIVGGLGGVAFCLIPCDKLPFQCRRHQQPGYGPLE